MKALVLSGGGARGAYQVGVLQAVAEVARQKKMKTPFRIYTGVSAGAINAGYLAAGADDFSLATQKLADMWSHLTSEKVFRTDALSMGKIGLQWMGELSFGALRGATLSRSLLDTAPLGSLIRDNLEFTRIKKNIDSKILHAVAVTAMDYKTSNAITFVQGQPEILDWARSRRHSEKAVLKPEHIMASSSIPLLFPPIPVEDRWFGDGCVRNQTPLSPALHLGASKLFIIGVRKQTETEDERRARTSVQIPSIARVANVLLNSVMLDGIEIDVERLNRVNDFMKQVSSSDNRNLSFKRVDHLWVHPSEDIGVLASKMSSRLPRLIRYLLKGLGPLDDAAEVISYLLFEPEFLTKLIEIGYKDGMNQAQQIEYFLEE